MLLPRVLTALVGLPLILFLIYWGGFTFSLFVACIAALSLYEYGIILSLGHKPTQRLSTVVVGSALALCQAFNGPVALVFAGGVAAVVLREMFSREKSLEKAALTLFGALLLGWMPAHLALIRELHPGGRALTFMLFSSIWAMDTAAYAVGQAWGRRALAPELSPKKTWEGALAAAITAVGVVLLFHAGFPDLLSWHKAVGIGFLVAVSGQVSDLSQSMIKRAVGVKDSGTLLPGHGGVMDRFDSFILGAPAVYYGLILL
ncbi:MAG: phosphatidate cytidylyltransferase [Elusimicrobia bacterium]|nr:phosphatidate cytidylyltransferase [Elusimicrobiota bacterium]